MFKIAAFARLGGVSSKVLRDYDSLDLFHPAWVDGATGYRLYSAAQLPELRRILALRDLGVGLAEIRSLVRDGADLGKVLERRRRALEEERRELDRRLASLGITTASVDAIGGLDIVVRTVPGELVAMFDVAGTDNDVGRAFYELELKIRDAGVRAPRPPGALVHGMPTGEWRAMERPATEVFVPVRRGATGLDVRRLQPVRAVTALHHGHYDALSETWLALDRWMAGSGLSSGRPIRILYLQFGAEEDLRLPRQYLVQRSPDLLTEIQVPVADEPPTTAGIRAAIPDRRRTL